MHTRRTFLKRAAQGFAWSGMLWLPKAQQVSAFPRRKIPVASSSPTLFASNLNDDDWESASSAYSQRINVTTNITVDSLVLRIYSTGSTGGVHIKCMTTASGDGGSQIGDVSNTVTVSSTSTTNEETFTWSAGNPVIVSGDPLFCVIVTEGGSQRFRISTNAGGTDYGDTTYAMYNPTSVYGSGTYDFWFKLYVT